MDRSFLSQPDVVAASRNFVCVRLATYEDKAENDFVTKLWAGTGRAVENTTFTILTPDAKKMLVRPARSPQRLYGNAWTMALEIDLIAKEYPKRPALGTLPLAANIRLGLNVAASDNLPLVVVNAKDELTRQRLTEQAAKLAWNDDFVGRFVYVVCSDAKELKPIQGAPMESIFVVQPAQFGLEGHVLKQAATDVKPTELAKLFAAAQAAFKPLPSNSVRQHIAAGQGAGVFWDTALPVTDRMEKGARERTKQAIEHRNR